MRHIYKLVILTLVLLQSVSAISQNNLSSADQRKLDAIKSNLVLDSLQLNQLHLLFNELAVSISQIDSLINATEISDLAEADIVLRVTVMQAEKREIKALRELDIKNILNPDQLTKYETEIQPQKPQVLHFGIHDRANCNVCTK
jgi:hypothetical protein